MPRQHAQHMPRQHEGATVTASRSGTYFLNPMRLVSIGFLLLDCCGVGIFEKDFEEDPPWRRGRLCTRVPLYLRVCRDGTGHRSGPFSDRSTCAPHRILASEDCESGPMGHGNQQHQEHHAAGDGLVRPTQERRTLPAIPGWDG